MYGPLTIAGFAPCRRYEQYDLDVALFAIVSDV